MSTQVEFAAPVGAGQLRAASSSLAEKRSRRFAMVCPNYHPLTCGIGDFSMRLARQLIDRGSEVALFTHAPAQPNPECPSIEVRGAAGRTPLEVVEAMGSVIADYQPSDLIIQYVPHMLSTSQSGSPAIPLLMAKWRQRAQVTVVFHELYLPWSWRPDIVITAALQRLQLCATIGSSDRMFVTTVERQRQLQHMLRNAGRKMPVELLFIGANAPPVARRRHFGTPRVGVFTTLARWRRLDVVVNAFTLIQRRHPDAELVFIGNLGTDASASFRELKAHIARSPVSKQIRLTGALPLSKVAEEVADLDAYLFPDENGPSTRSSTLPIAFGSGVPVVALCGRDTPRDFFVDGENITFVPSMTPAELARSTLRILEDQSWADKLAEGGRLLYDRHLSWTVIADHVLSTIDAS